MENVSNALIIAATTILAVLLMGVFVYIFKAGSNVSETYDKKQQSEQLELYNSRFEIYNSQSNTIMDLISVSNLAYSANIESQYDSKSTANIIINAGPKRFIIPGDDRRGLNKNQILSGNTPMSIYKLATDDLDSLGIEHNNKTDTLSITKYKDSKTIYKYLFNCEKIEYHSGNGQVSKMEFRMYKNLEY